MGMFVNPFLKQEEWIKRNKSCFKLLDDFGVGVTAISSKMEVLALNTITKKWFPNINVGERPICYKSFNIPPRDEICEYCPTIKTLTDGKVHEAITETLAGDKIINYRVVSSPVKDENGNIIAAIEVVEDITGHRQADERIEELNKCFLNFGTDYRENIKCLTNLCGKLLGATCALYNRLNKEMLCSVGRWNVPSDCPAMDTAEGHICYDVIQRASDRIFTVRDLQHSKYAKTDPNVKQYNLQTYIGKAVKCGGIAVGSLCVVYQKDFIPTQEDEEFLSIIASAIGVEEERRRSDEALLESEKNYRELVESANSIILRMDPKGNITFFNKFAQKFFGYTEEEILGRNGVGTIVPKIESSGRDLKVMIEEIAKYPERYAVNENENMRKNGERVWIHWTNKIIFDKEKNLKEVLCVGNDMTEHKRLQEEIRTSEEKYRKLFEEANDAIFIGDVKTGKILDANVQAERLLGRTKDEICRMHQSQLHPLEEKERYKAIFKEDIFVGRGTHLDAEVIDKKGVRIPISISASVQETGGRKIVMGIFKDMSEFRRIESQKKEAEALALVDPHTQLYNYRYFQRRIYSEFEAAKRRGTPLSVLMVDIDYFKSINDTYGHEYGDVVLKEFATVLQHACRGIDVVTRFEGEGFAIILPDTDEKGAVSFSERIQSVVKKHRFGKHRARLMVSIGAASYPSEGINSVDKLVTSVDKCVQMAKEKGGNTIFVYEQLRYKGQKPATIDKDSQRRVKEVSRKFIKLIQLNKQNTIEAVYALAHTVGAKNAYTEEHSEDMVHYATEIGKRLRMSEEELEDLKHGAMLHDIGKLGISDKILLKRGKLTKKEFEAIKKHPHIGADIIRPMHFLKSVVPIILHHHERFDGAGYGSRLKGEEIPLGARVVAIVDVYQALVSNRPYRKAYSKKEAIDIIKEESGRHFDPKITKVFLEVLAKEKKTKKKGAAKKR